MAIYVNNLGDSQTLPLAVNDPKDGDALIWSEELGAYVNAPASTTEEAIQDTVAEMLDVDPAGSNVSLRLVSNYDDASGKLTFNVVADAGTPGGGSTTLSIQENGAERGTATTLNFVGPTVSLVNNVASITGILNSIGISNTGTNLGDVTKFNFEGFGLSITGDTVTVANTNSGSGNYTLPTATTSVLGGVKVDGTTITIDGNGVITAIGGTGGYVLPTASGSTLGGIKIGSGLSIDANGVVSSSGGLSTSDLQNYLTTNNYTTKTYVDGQITNLINGAASTLDTLNELAAALNNDANFATTITTGLTNKLNISGGTMTGALTLAADPVSPLQAATKNYVDTQLSSFAPVTSLADLSDVDLTGATSGYVLTFDGTNWAASQGTPGPAGATGATGPAGASVTSATVSVTGRLLVTLSTGTVVDAGSVAGISSAAVDGSGDLILTKQDGTTINAGSTVGPQGPQGIQGPTGLTGPAGASITSATIDGTGHLILTKSDSSTIDAGSAIGPAGPQGATGATGAKGDTGDQGVGVASAVVSGGSLVLTLTNGTDITAGDVTGPQGPQGVQGPAGRSIADSGVVVDGSGNLQVTLTDGVTINAGYVVGPQGSTGPKGDTGEQGPQGIQGIQGPQGDSYTINGITGSVQVYGLSSTSQAGYDLEVDLANRAGRLATARTISLAGKVTGLTSFDGSGNVSITTALSGVTTSDVTEGVSNLYFTQARARTSISSTADSSISSLISYDDTTGVIKYRASTSYITEGSNLYFTNTRADARADARIAAASINALADVDTATATPTSGQALVWNGTAWVPGTVSGGAGAVSSVNTKTGAVVLNTDDVAEGTTNLYYTTTRWDQRLSTKTTDNLTEGSTNKYFSNTLARNAVSAGTGLSFNSSTGAFTLNANTDQVSEGSSNLYYTNGRFDTRLGQSNLSQLADVADTTPTSGQALAWNGSAWAPTTISGGGGGEGAASGVFRASVQVEYDASGNLTSASVLSGGISAVIANSAANTATVTFTFTGSVCAPLGVQVYGYQRTANIYVSRALASDFSTRTMAGGGSSGTPTAFSAFDSSVNTMTLSLTKALTGASANVGVATHCVVQFLLSSI